MTIAPYTPSTSNQTALKLCVFGAPLDTGNLGVSALGHSVLNALEASGRKCVVTLFDYGHGENPLKWNTHDPNPDFQVNRCGAYRTRRLYRPESLARIRWSCKAGGLGNPGARALRDADAILDISGGDSFTDLYGRDRFESVALPKLIALENRADLILLPQTYGPFATNTARKEAEKIVRHASAAFARDARSFEVLKELLGEHFDARRHQAGVDVAFRLPAVKPSAQDLAIIDPWLNDDRTELAGLNVSGLLLNRPQTASAQYGIKADYFEIVSAFIRRLLEKSDARVLLIPHVVTPVGHHESDIEACKTVAEQVADTERVQVCPAMTDPRHAKWLVSRCDWFCGTRMHSTIAALSSGVPAAAIAYSSKTRGVFESCRQGAHVADPRHLDTDEVVNLLWDSWQSRDATRTALNAALPSVLERANEQMAAILNIIDGKRDQTRRASSL